MSGDGVTILGFAGSLRKDANSKKVVRFALSRLQKTGASVTFVDLKDFDIPMYDADIEEAGFPENVQRLKDLVRGADAILIGTPEYNLGSPGVLKNAINWLSRPYGDSALAGKLVALISSSPGRIGGARALADLRMSVGGTGAWVYPPAISIGQVDQILDERGNINDARLVSTIDKFLNGFIIWAGRFREFSE